jgi:hypothetical protein
MSEIRDPFALELRLMKVVGRGAVLCVQGLSDNEGLRSVFFPDIFVGYCINGRERNIA